MPTFCLSLWTLKSWERTFLEDILTGSWLRVEGKGESTKQDNDR